MDEKIMQQAVLWEGKLPEDWVLEGARETRAYRFRYYRASDGRFFYTLQPAQKEGWPRYDVHQHNGITYARKRWKRKPYEA